MGKTLIINMTEVKLEGDILDVASDNKGVIYSIYKEIDDEISIDYVDESNRNILRSRRYDACTFFFNLNSIWRAGKKDALIKEVTQYIKDDGMLYIWDVNKERGKVIDSKVKIVLPGDKIKEFEFRNMNPILTSSLEEVKKILEKYYKIEETKVWEDIFFIKGIKKKLT